MAAWPLAAAALACTPAAGHAAAASAAMDPRLATMVASAPHLTGPLRVLAAFGTPTSAWRSVEHNRRVGGATNSYHLLGHAIDVQRRPGVTHQMLDAALRRAGYLLVESIDEIDHSHFAFLPGRIALRSVALAAPVPVAAVPEKPQGPRVAADEHGTLLIDNGRSDAQPSTPAGPAGSSPGLASAR
jgi:hypothetical protein